MGFVYFQGYFFSPARNRDQPRSSASRLHYMRLLEIVSRIDLEHAELETMLKQEASFPTACFAI